MNDKGGVGWDIDNWSFLLNGKEYDSINPSLHLSISATPSNAEHGIRSV
jgi:alkyl sulfatase BDS1-like metallo-beta-lactamase superfamily hydrolase